MRILILSLALLATTALGPAAAAPLQQASVVENAEDVWQGPLVDWDCKQVDPEPACGAGMQTKQFALSIDGGILLRFDEHGNVLAAQAVRKAGRAGDATAVGKRDGRLLRVESIRIGSVEISWLNVD